MTEMTDDKPQVNWRIKLAFVLFVLSLIMPVFLLIPAVMKLSPKTTATLSGGVLVLAEVLMLVAAAVAGKSGYAYIKSRVFGFLKQYAPPREVSRTRYFIGLVIFSVPLLYGWLGPYIEAALRLEFGWVLYAVLDISFVVSFFILGGEFWEKIRSLFRHGTKVAVAEKATPKPPQP